MRMEREHFLKEIWSPYPSASAHWLDVASYLAARDADPALPRFVCGRLEKKSAGKLRLSSGGAAIEFKLAAVIHWLPGQKKPHDFSDKLLENDDLVCVECLEGEVRGLLLLTPSRASFKLNSPFAPERATQWAAFTGAVRQFFSNRGFTEAFTPTLVPSPGTEPYLDPFSTEWHLGSQTQTFFLPTSPEFHLKKMLVAGWTRLFEIKTCFRNGEISRHHQPEFHMLEWYRAYSNLDVIADDTEALISEVAAIVRPSLRVPKLKRTTIAALFAEAFPGFALKPETTREDLLALATREKIQTSANDSFDDVFFRLFLERIEDHLGKEGPLLVRGYPPSQAALSRIGPDGFADRFEVYWRGLELANAFHELNDPAENESRFRDDHRRKLELEKPEVPVDEELVKALYHGLPPSGGIALGMERLFMAIFELETIGETRAFPKSGRRE
jgi:lysyl-tRNA synthetase class 2